jgi:sn-glycerol 3-phosphate transport system permease protein
MIIHSNMVPYFVLTVLAGGGFMAFSYRRWIRTAQEQSTASAGKRVIPPYKVLTLRFENRNLVVVGAVVGAVAGLVGPMVFMVPLQSCTFEPERAPLDVAFGIFLFLLGGLLLVLGTRWISRLTLIKGAYAALTEGQTSMGVFNAPWWVPGILLVPTIAILVIFLYYPLIETFRLSTLLVRLGAPRTVFRCVDNFTGLLEPNGFDVGSLVLFLGVVAVLAAYRRLNKRGGVFGLGFITTAVVVTLSLALLSRILESDYGEVLFNTFFISSSIVIFGLAFGLAIAYLAFQPVKGAFIYRTLLIWPYAMSPAIAGIIFFVMFDPVAGVINHIIELMGGQGADWIRDPWLARLAVILTSVWKTTGYNILFYIAGLQTIPSELSEAASIDGANGWQRFRHIVLPSLSPITFFLIVTNLTYAFFSIFGTI